MPWNVGLVWELGSYSAFSTADAVLLYDTRNSDGVTGVANEGTGGHTYDLNTWNGLYEVRNGAGTAGLSPWVDWGGAPGDAPLTFIAAFKQDPDGYGFALCLAESALPMTIDLGLYVLAWDRMKGIVAGLFSAANNESEDLAFPSSINQLYTVEIDPVAGTITNRIGNTIMPPRAGYSDTFVGGGGYLNTTFGGGNANGWDLRMNFGVRTPGQIWDGAGGMALTRTVLTDAERNGWATYFGM